MKVANMLSFVLYPLAHSSEQELLQALRQAG